MEDDGTPPRLYFKVKCKMEDDGTPPKSLCFKVGCKIGMMVHPLSMYVDSNNSSCGIHLFKVLA